MSTAGNYFVKEQLIHVDARINVSKVRINHNMILAGE
jgi:hypothetical protein